MIQTNKKIEKFINEREHAFFFLTMFAEMHPKQLSFSFLKEILNI